MKRQERLSLFFEREEAALNEAVASVSGFAGIYYGARSAPNLKNLNLPHFFTASNQQEAGAGVVFHQDEWPLPTDYFDLLILDHPFDLGFDFDCVMKEVLRIICKDGTLLITGFNKTRLCSWPIQNTFGQEVACPIKRYSPLRILALLDKMGFITEVRYFDFCRFRFWNKILAKVFPFLGIGFIIEAKRRTVDLKPLEEMSWNFAPEKILKPIAQPECFNKKNPHGDA